MQVLFNLKFRLKIYKIKVYDFLIYTYLVYILNSISTQYIVSLILYRYFTSRVGVDIIMCIYLQGNIHCHCKLYSKKAKITT